MRIVLNISAYGLAGVLTLGSWGCATTQSTGSSSGAPPPELAGDADFARGREALSRMGGCFLVDYNFSETKALAQGYTRDERVYDVNQKKTVLEWIYSVEEGKKIRLQHVLFALDEQGQFMEGSLLRHQAEDWEYAPAYYFEYQGQSRWKKVRVEKPQGQWARRVTNLDDGLRYQCVGAWVAHGQRLEWECGDNFAPIPGRETRDMKRSDYQALVRATRLVSFPSHFVERQKNVKTVVAGEERKPLAEEVGRNWYLRMPEKDCQQAMDFTKARGAYWRLLQETWAELFEQVDDFTEVTPPEAPPRFMKIMELEDEVLPRLADPAGKAEAKKRILEIIQTYRPAAAPKVP